MAGRLRVGTCGWQYDHWQGRLYPRGLPRDEWFSRYAERFDCVEIDNTFYGLPDADVFDRWRERAPPRFRYALKFSRYGTHLKKLRDPEQTVRTFVERASRLRSRLGPILVQLPPHWHRDCERLRAFLAVVPRRLRWVVELRDPTWLDESVFEVLREVGAALCIHDLLDDHPRVHTASWSYWRFHGTPAGGYSPQLLAARARDFARELEQGRDVWALFNNDAGGRAVEDALALRRHVEVALQRGAKTRPRR